MITCFTSSRERTFDLLEDCYSRESEDKILNQKLQETVQGELFAHFKYLMFADRAKRRALLTFTSP